MSFWDDFLPIAGTVGGGIAGSFFGNPMLGAGIGGSLGSVGARAIDSANGGDPNDIAAQRVKMYQELLASMPKYVGPPPGQGLTATDQYAMRKARTAGQNFASGREQALLSSAMARGGGAVTSGALLSHQNEVAQDASNRVSDFDLGQAGIAAERDAKNRQLINEFNQRNTMAALGIANGASQAMGAQGDLSERERSAASGNYANLFNTISAYGLRNANQKGTPWSPSDEPWLGERFGSSEMEQPPGGNAERRSGPYRMADRERY
jgi:hypothetical protein